MTTPRKIKVQVKKLESGRAPRSSTMSVPVTVRPAVVSNAVSTPSHVEDKSEHIQDVTYQHVEGEEEYAPEQAQYAPEQAGEGEYYEEQGGQQAGQQAGQQGAEGEYYEEQAGQQAAEGEYYPEQAEYYPEQAEYYPEQGEYYPEQQGQQGQQVGGQGEYYPEQQVGGEGEYYPEQQVEGQVDGQVEGQVEGQGEYPSEAGDQTVQAPQAPQAGLQASVQTDVQAQAPQEDLRALEGRDLSAREGQRQTPPEGQDLSALEEDETEFSVGDDDFEEVHEIHPQITKLLDILTADGKVFVLREDDLKNIFIRTLKMQGIMIEQINGVRELLENVVQEIETLQPTTAKVQSDKGNGSKELSSANELLETLAGSSNKSKLKETNSKTKENTKTNKTKPKKASTQSRIHNGRLSLRRTTANSNNKNGKSGRRGGDGTTAKTTKDVEAELEKLLSGYTQDKGHEQQDIYRPGPAEVLEGGEGDGGDGDGGDYDPDDPEVMENLRANLAAFFHRIYVLDLTNKARDLVAKLQEVGFDNLEIVPKNKANTGLVNALPELIAMARKEGYERIMILKDNVLIHENIIGELAKQLPRLKDKARVLYMGAAYMRTKNHGVFDPEFYLETYPDLERSGIDNAEKAQKHWKSSGHRQGRWGSRNLSHPEIVKDLSAICLHMDVFDALIQSMASGRRRADQSFKTFEKVAAEVVYALTPPPFMNELTKLNRMKNRYNAFLYK